MPSSATGIIKDSR